MLFIRYKLINLHTFYILKLKLKTLNAKHKRLLKIILFTGIVIGYVLGFGIIFNLKNVLGIGSYDGTKSFTTSVDGSTGGLNIELYAQHDSQLYHFYGYTITTFSDSDIEVVGISYAYYMIRTGGILRQSIDENFTTPLKSYSWDGRATIRENNNFTIQGYADVIFLVDTVDQIKRVAIDFGIIIELDGEEINYEWGNISTWLNVIYLTLTVIPLTLLYRNIKAYKFEKWYNEELEERDERFYRILSKESEE